MRLGGGVYYVFIATIEFVPSQLNHAHSAHFPEPDLLDVEAHRLIGFVLIAPHGQAVIPFILPMRRTGHVVRGWYWIAAVFLAIQFRRMRHHPDVYPMIAS